MPPGPAAGEDAVGQGEPADVGARAEAGRAAARGVQARHRAAVGPAHLPGLLRDHQPAEGQHRRRVGQPGPDRAVDQRERRPVLHLDQLGRFAGRIRLARCRRRVVGGQRGREAGRVDPGARRHLRDRGRADPPGGQQVQRLQPLEPQRAPAQFATSPGHGVAVGEQPCLSLVPGHDGLADRRAVARLVAYPAPGAVHQHAVQQGGRRAEEAPDRDPVHEPHRAAGLDAEPDPAAVVAGRPQRQAAPVGRRVLAHHRPVGHEPAGRQHHPAPGAHQQRAAVAALQPDHRPVQHAAHLRRVQVRPGRPAVQDPVSRPRPGGPAAQGPALDPGHASRHAFSPPRSCLPRNR